MVTKQAATAARRRAREAKARRDAERQAQEKKIADANEEFYIACAEMEEAQGALDAATDRRNEAVRALVALEQDDEAVAELTGLATRDVAKIKKTPGQATQSKETARPGSAGVGDASDTRAASGSETAAVPV